MSGVQFTISWIYEEFRVAKVTRGELSKVWDSPKPVSDLASFHEALIAASAALGMNNGGDVAITFESDEHSHAFIDLPPMNQRDVEKYLVRRIEQDKTFEEDPVWSYRKTEHHDESNGVLVHVMPKKKLDAIIRICQENHLTPMRLLPLTDVMAQHLPSHYDGEENIVLVVALFEERVEIVVATELGEILFVRELQYHWREDGLERLRVDLDRTVLYMKQRHRGVTRFALMGVEAKSAAEVLQPHVKFPLDIDTSALDPYFWAKTVAGMPSEVSSNFIPKTVQRTAVRKKAVRAASWLAVAASLCAIVVTAWVEVLLHEQSKLDPEIDRSIIELTAKRESLQQLESELGNLNARLAQLSARHPAIPAWFLSRLGEMVPDAAVLRSAELALENGQWVFEIEGATSPTLAASAETLAQFESKLAEQPWSASVSDDWRMEWLDQLRSGQAAKTGLLGFRLIGRVF